MTAAQQFTDRVDGAANATPPYRGETVHHAIAAVIQALPAVEKDSQMQGQESYRYRGIEDILAAVKPVMARHGVHFTPHAILDVTDSEYQVRSGATWQRSRMTVEFRFYGPQGDHITAVTRGEGTDRGDKAANKAMTAAMKYALVQVFAISDAGADDPDHEQGPEQVPTWTLAAAKQEVFGHLPGSRDDEAAKELARGLWAKHGPKGKGPFVDDDLTAVLAAAATAEAQQ